MAKHFNIADMYEMVADKVPAGNVLYTVGTTFDSGGRSHAYLLWMPTDENLLRLRSYSIWSKPGAADAAGVYQPESWIEVQTDPVVLEGILREAAEVAEAALRPDSLEATPLQANPLAAALAELGDRPAWRRQLGAAGRRRAEELFDRRRNVGRLHRWLSAAARGGTTRQVGSPYSR